MPRLFGGEPGAGKTGPGSPRRKDRHRRGLGVSRAARHSAQGGSHSMAAKLKLYVPPEDQSTQLPDPDVRVRLGDLLPLVAAAQRMNFVWLKDFLDDEVAVTQDLYEVMQSFRAGNGKPTSACLGLRAAVLNPTVF